MANIIVVITCVIALGAGIFGWWFENGGSSGKTSGDTKKTETEKQISDVH